MLLENAALALWYAIAPMSIINNSTQLQTIILVSCWVNGILSTLVSLLILFRSMEGGSATEKRLLAVAPWLPLPPQADVRTSTTLVKTETRVEKINSFASQTLTANELQYAHTLSGAPDDEGQSPGSSKVRFSTGILPTEDRIREEPDLERMDKTPDEVEEKQEC
jgi:hypothetical protein